MERLEKPEDQEVFCETVSPRNKREVVSMKHQQYECLNNSNVNTKIYADIGWFYP